MQIGLKFGRMKPMNMNIKQQVNIFYSTVNKMPSDTMFPIVCVCVYQNILQNYMKQRVKEFCLE